MRDDTSGDSGIDLCPRALAWHNPSSRSEMLTKLQELSRGRRCIPPHRHAYGCPATPQTAKNTPVLLRRSTDSPMREDSKLRRPLGAKEFTLHGTGESPAPCVSGGGGAHSSRDKGSACSGAWHPCQARPLTPWLALVAWAGSSSVWEADAFPSPL